MGQPPLWSVIPFVCMLGGIAILPLFAHHWWEDNKNRAIFTAAVSTPILIYLFLYQQPGHGGHSEHAALIPFVPVALVHALLEYVSFIALIGSLYIIAGGIHLSGDLQATPARNTLIMGIGAVLANFIGTTGASMLLIRTILRTNRQREHRAHIPVFFILTVSNCGGLLTPLGDPPLFLGYLREVPFFWTLGLYPFWFLAVGWLMAVFFFVDTREYAKESATALARDEREQVPLRIAGWTNVGLLTLIVAAVFLPPGAREVAMFGLAGASVFLGPKEPRSANGFTYAPILEVAILFVGIFTTMIPALQILEHQGSQLGLTEAWQFFLITGGLSSVLDNAPTYLTFFTTAQSLGIEGASMVVRMPAIFLTAISVGAVFMGANTYIGNGPNFMVKAIAEESGYRMPSFFGYALQAVTLLTPVYIVIVAVLMMY